MAQSVERVLGKDEVTSSNLVSSSRNHSKYFAYCGFLLCGDRVLPGAWGRRAGEAEQSPHVLSPRGPRKYGVFLGRNGSPVQIWLAAPKRGKQNACRVFCYVQVFRRDAGGPISTDANLPPPSKLPGRPSVRSAICLQG